MTPQDLKTKSILYLVHRYDSFTKDSIEQTAEYFKHVYVLVRYKPVAEISNLIPIYSLKSHRKKIIIDLSNSHKNITVLTTPVWYLPTTSGYMKLGKKHFDKTIQIIQKNKISFDIIHSHFVWTAGYVGSKIGQIFNIPFVLTAHGYDIYELPFIDKAWRKKITDICNAANSLITVSQSNLEVIRKLRISTPITVVPNGYDSKLFYPKDQDSCRKKLNLPLDRKIVLTIGGLSEIKGHKYLIQSMQKIVKKEPTSLCIIIGEGRLRNKLQKQINSTELKDNIILTGFKPHHEVLDWINSCDLFVLPSISESFGVVQIEAMACGKPIVATRNGGSEEIITSKSLGFLVKKKDPKDLYEKIWISLEKQWDQKEIIKQAQNYRLEKVHTQIIKQYQNLLTQNFN